MSFRIVNLIIRKLWCAKSHCDLTKHIRLTIILSYLVRIQIHFDLTIKSFHCSTVDDHTVFSVHAQIIYTKKVWAVVKGFIEKNTWIGMEEYYTSLVKALQTEFCIPPAKAKARRTRRSAASQQRPLMEENPRVSIKPQPSLPSTPTVKLKVPPSEAKPSFEALSWFVIILLILLICINVILYVKLWYLEERTTETFPFPKFPELK